MGVEVLDNQHKELVFLINDLYLSLEENKDLQTIHALYSQLLTHTKEHFLSEEAIFQQLNQPETARHKLLHSDLLNQLYETENRFNLTDKQKNMENMNFLRDWLTRHILLEDKRFSPMYRERTQNE